MYQRRVEWRLGMLIVLTALACVLAIGPAAADSSMPPSSPAEGGFTPPKPKDGYSYPDCYCTDSLGKRVELGQTSCLRIGSRQVLARCAMSLNNPIWRRMPGGCPSV